MNLAILPPKFVTHVLVGSKVDLVKNVITSMIFHLGASLCLTDGSGRWQNFWLTCYELVTVDYVYGLMTLTLWNPLGCKKVCLSSFCTGGKASGNKSTINV